MDIKRGGQGYKYFNILSLLYLTCMIVTYLFAYKMTEVAGILVSSGIFVFPLTYLIGDVSADAYGYLPSLKLIFSAIFCGGVFVAITMLLTKTPPPPFWHHQAQYNSVFEFVFRFYIANTIGIILGQASNIYLFSKTGEKLNGKYFVLRSIFSSSFGELITSIIADIIAFIGVLDFSKVIHLIITIYVVKVLYAVVLSVPGSYLSAYLKQKESDHSLSQANDSILSKLINERI